jgi:hypothetical protein
MAKRRSFRETLVGLLILVGGCVWLAGTSPDPETRTTQPAKDATTPPKPSNAAKPVSPIAKVEPEPEKAPAKLGNSTDAILFAQRLVERNLKFPDDSSFPWFSTSATYTSLDGWRVTGKVKAKNSLGAALTYSWTAIVFYESGSWHERSLTLDGQTVEFNNRTNAELEILSNLAAEQKRRRIEAAKSDVQKRVEARIKAENADASLKDARLRKASESRITLTKELIRNKKAGSTQRKWMEEIIANYPDSDLAKQASELLEMLR